MSAPPLDLHAISHPIVKSAIEAMNGKNKEKWYALFSNNPTFTDDGNPHNVIRFNAAKADAASLSLLSIA